MMRYELEYKPCDYMKRENIRKIALSISIVIDFLTIALIISAIFKPLIWIAVVLLPFISNAIRYAVNIYPKRYLFGIADDKFYVNEVSPLRRKCLLEKDIKDINAINIGYDIGFMARNEANVLFLYDNSCQNDAYVIEFSDKRVIAPIDEYMYTLIKKGIQEE